MKTLLIGIVCLAAGFFAGVLVPFGRESAPAPSRESTDAAMKVGDPRQLDSVESESESNSNPEGGAIQKAQSEVTHADKAETLRVSPSFIEELSRKAGARTAGQALFERDGVIEAALGISNQEKAVIQTAWQNTQQGIREIEARASVSKELEDYSVHITVPDLSREMKRLESSFSSSVQQALGENRGDVFLAAKQVDQMIANSGGPRTYTVAAEPVGEDEWRFRMTQEGADGRRVWVGDSIPAEIRHLTDMARISPRIDTLPE